MDVFTSKVGTNVTDGPANGLSSEEGRGPTVFAMEPDEMRVVTEFAALAPSVHNTQPWGFVARRYALEVRADPERGLNYLDPGGRQMYLSCGIVVEFARLAIRSFGRACTVRLLPDVAQENLVAKLVMGLREPATAAEQRLIDAVPRRYTDRGPYSEEPVSPDVLQHLREAVAERHCWLRVLDRPADRLTAVRLLSNAEYIEANDPEYRAELAAWRRTRPSRDGVPLIDDMTWDAAHRVTDVPLRDFTGQGQHPRPGGGTPPAVERDTIVLLGSDYDDRVSWLRAGRALADALLILTDAGLVSQPLGPVLDLPGTRAQLRRELGLVGHPQMLLRLGRGASRPSTGRRPVDDMLSVDATP